jgi:N-alpha-acetyltransferase 35, NatC auxiliary subunit
MLDDILVDEFRRLLDQALGFMDHELSTAQNAPSNVLSAIHTRLQFRKLYLEIVSFSDNVLVEPRPGVFEECQTHLTKIIETLDLGKHSFGAFSTRTQRKLSMSTPPRPIVAVDPKEAAGCMKALLKNLADLDSLQTFTSPHEIMVFPW